MIKLNDLFKINNGNGFYLKNMDIGGDINYISMSGNNNGISGSVKVVEGTEPFSGGLITVAMQGTVLSTFIQPNKFYTSLHVAVLEPKVKMTDKEKLFYCMCIEANKFRYSYGRKANRTLKDLLVPHPGNIPSWVYEANIPDYSNIPLPYSEEKTPELKVEEWKEFRLDELFEVSAGTYIKSGHISDIKTDEHSTVFISSTSGNNGVKGYVKEPLIHKPSITIGSRGNDAICFYHDYPIWPSNNVSVIVPKFNMSQYVAMFIVQIISMEKYRYSYGRIMNSGKARETIIKLPSTKEGNPDWKWMENYIKTLKFSGEV